MSVRFAETGRLPFSVLVVLLLMVSLASWQWVFHKMLDKNYLLTCLDFGPTVLIFNALITAIWDGFNKNRNLISPNPLLFISAWLATAAGICLSFSNATRIPSLAKGDDVSSQWELGMEGIFSAFIFLVVLVVLFAWLLFAMPFLYFVFLFAASPIRQSLRSIDAGSFTKYPILSILNKATLKTEYFSLNEKPVASAFAISSFCILVMKMSVTA
jgi:hypothetical protein